MRGIILALSAATASAQAPAPLPKVSALITVQNGAADVNLAANED